MRPEISHRRKKHSRRRRGSRGREIFTGFLLLLFLLLLIAGLTAAGVFGYRYWEGSRIPDSPLESSREVVPETMWETH